MVVLLLLFLLFPDGFLPCDHGLDFFRSAYVRIQSNQRKKETGNASVVPKVAVGLID